MTVRGAPGEPPLTVEGFKRDKEAAFKSLMSGITGQPADWIDVIASEAASGSATAGQDPAAPAAVPAPAPVLEGAVQRDALLLASQVYAPEAQLAGVAAALEEAAANGTLALQLRSLGLVLEEGSGERCRSLHAAHALATSAGVLAPLLRAYIRPLPAPALPRAVSLGTPAPEPPPPSPPGPPTGPLSGSGDAAPDEGSSSSSIVPIVVPIVCVAAALLAAAVGAALWRRRRRHAQTAAEVRAVQHERQLSRARSQTSGPPSQAPSVVAEPPESGPAAAATPADTAIAMPSAAAGGA